MNQPRLRLGEILMESGLLTKENLARALDIQQESQLRLGTILLQEGFISEAFLLQALSRHLSIPWVSIWRIDIPTDALNLVPANVAEEFFLIPIYIRLEKGGEKALYVAMNDPSDTEALRFIAQTAGMDVRPMIAGPSDIASAIRFYYYGEDLESVPPLNPLAEPQEEAVVEDLSEEVELVSSEPLPIDLYASKPPRSVESRPPRNSIQPSTNPSEQPELATATVESSEATTDAASENLSRPPRISQVPDVEIPERLSTAPTITEDGAEVYQNREAAQREAERRIYGVGRKRAAAGFALTLLDGTTLSFVGNRESVLPSMYSASPEGFWSALSVMAEGEQPDITLPAEKWAAYTCALMHLLTRNGLISDERLADLGDAFLDTVAEITSETKTALSKTSPGNG